MHIGFSLKQVHMCSDAHAGSQEMGIYTHAGIHKGMTASSLKNTGCPLSLMMPV